MLIPKRVSSSLLSTCVAAACLLTLASARVRTQAGGQGQRQAGAPLKGVDVKLGRYAGAQFAGGGMATFVAHATTGADGHFKLPVVPAGKYVLVLELPGDARKAAGPDTKIDTQQGQPDARAYVTLKLPGDKKVEVGYDFAQKKAFDPALLDKPEQAAARTKPPLTEFVYESDGVTPCEGAINTSRSNIKNTFE